MTTDRILLHSSFSHIVVDVPIERIDIADWLLTLTLLPARSYRGRATSTDSGPRMSINVEMIGETL